MVTQLDFAHCLRYRLGIARGIAESSYTIRKGQPNCHLIRSHPSVNSIQYDPQPDRIQARYLSIRKPAALHTALLQITDDGIDLVSPLQGWYRYSHVFMVYDTSRRLPY